MGVAASLIVVPGEPQTSRTARRSVDAAVRPERNRAQAVKLSLATAQRKFESHDRPGYRGQRAAALEG
jgi:hypothetical protein